MKKIIAFIVMTFAIVSCKQEQEKEKVEYERFGITVQLYKDYDIIVDKLNESHMFYLRKELEQNENTQFQRSSFSFLITEDSIAEMNYLKKLEEVFIKDSESKEHEYRNFEYTENSAFPNSQKSVKYILDVNDTFTEFGKAEQLKVGNQIVIFSHEYSQGIREEHFNCLKLIQSSLKSNSKKEL